MGIHVNGNRNVVHNNVVTYNEAPRELPRAPFFTFFIVMAILVSLVIKYWQVTLVAASLAAIAYGTWLEKQEKRRTESEAQRRQAALAYRAEEQNSAYLQGDLRGVYGNYPPSPEAVL